MIVWKMKYSKLDRTRAGGKSAKRTFFSGMNEKMLEEWSYGVRISQSSEASQSEFWLTLRSVLGLGESEMSHDVWCYEREKSG